MEKLNDIKYFIFSFFLFNQEWKSGKMKKMSLNKFTHIPFLKNDVQLKQKMRKHYFGPYILRLQSIYSLYFDSNQFDQCR